jgi:FG-GAP repeat
MDDNNMWGIGAPNMADTNSIDSGAVVTSTLVDGKWTFLPFLYGKSSGDGFGTAIDLSFNHMIVGAPFVFIANTTTSAGAAYYYTFDPSSTTWVESGFMFRSNDDLLSANGEFGASVALGLFGDSKLPRVVIGARKHNVATDALEVGRVYTFEAETPEAVNWSALETNPLLGKTAYDWFGASVDMSNDGSRIVVGAPGTNMSGYIQVYEWDGTQWNVDFEQEGTTGEGFGSYVVMLADDTFAVGGPGYEDGSGRVIVYRRSSGSLQRAASDYSALGEPIVGTPGDRLGSDGTITGGKHGDNNELILIVSTATGQVQTYSFDESVSMWKPSFEALSTGTNSGVMVEYSATAGLITGYPEGDEVSLYESAVTTVAPASSPIISTTAPVAVTATSSPTTAVAPVPTATVNATLAPTTTSIVTNSTTEPPISSTMNWILAGDSFTPQTADGSGYGTSVSISATYMVVGAPLTLSNGAVFVYSKDSTSGLWTTDATGQLFGTAAGIYFGASVDISSNNVIAVGSPRTVVRDTLTEFGAVDCYSLVNGLWEPLGVTILGDESVFSASEMFGASVSVSTTNRIVIGAPYNNLDSVLLRGRVYVYEYSSTTSAWSLLQTMEGQASNDAFGTAVDMSADGTQFVVGAPGGGYAELMEYNGSTWSSVFRLPTGTTGFGTSVVLIALNLFAVGDPNYSSNVGRVVVYRKDDASGTFAQLGPDITGTTAGDLIGAYNTIAGVIDVNTSTISMMMGTANGTVRRMDYDPTTNTWVLYGTIVTTNFGTNLKSVAASSSEEFVVGGTNNAEIYQLSV